MLGAAILLAFSGVSGVLPLTAQAAVPSLTIVNSSVATTPSSLAQLLLGPGATLDPGTPATVNGATAFVATEQSYRSYGSFTNGSADLGLEDGLVIAANADAATFATPATADRVAGDRNDAALDALLATEAGLCNGFPCTRNATDLSFGVEAAGDFIKFEYVLAITEAGASVGAEWHPSSDVFRYPDGFGLFVNGNNVADNCAVVPSTGQYLTMKNAKIVPPTGSAASNRAAALATVAPNQRFAYAVENTDWRVRFLTVPLTCVVDVSAEHLAGAPVAVRIVIADANDNAVPPAVFLKGGSVRFEATVEPTPPAAPAWLDQALGTLRTGVAVVDGVEASGFPWPTYSISAGTLPAGLSLNPSTGAITGTPTTVGAYDFTITASNGIGADATKQFTGSVTAADGDVVVETPVVIVETPVRLVDTRVGDSKIEAGTVTHLVLADTVRLPDDTTAVVLNVTVTNPQQAGFITLYPCGTEVPQVSSINFEPGVTVANAVTVSLGTGGEVCVFASVATDFVVDLNWVYGPGAAAGHLVALNPSRLLDTRESAVKIVGGAVFELAVDGHGVPGDATAVLLNVTATEPEVDGFMTVYACDAEIPLTSNVNFLAGATVANTAVVRLSAADKVCFLSSSTTHLVVDVNGAFTPAPTGFALRTQPERVLDTRETGIEITADVPLVIDLSGIAAVVDGTTAITLNVTIVEPDGDGFATVYPCEAGLPLASNVNFTRGVTVANSATVPIGSDVKVCIRSTRGAHLVVDLYAVYVDHI